MEKTVVQVLLQDVKQLMSEKRYIHTVGVMKMACEIGSYCLNNRVTELACAALLHDVAKEITDDELLSIIKRSCDDYENKISYGREAWHSFAAPYVIKRDFPSFATPEVLSSVEKHTVGAADMSVFDEIIFISDYIELGRIYPSCIAVREYLLGALKPDKLSENIIALHKSCIMAIEYTVENLMQRGKAVCPESLLAKNALESKIK